MPLRRSILPVVAILVGAGTVVSTQSAQRSASPPVTLVSPVPPPATQLEGLLTRPDLVIAQDLYRVSDPLTQGFGLTIDVVMAQTLPNGTRLQGLRVEVLDPNQAGHARRSYLDVGELAGLSQGIAQMADLARQWTGREETRAKEAHFASADGFVVGFHQDSRNQEGYIAAGLVDTVRHSCRIDDFDLIKRAVDDAMSLLRQKGGL